MELVIWVMERLVHGTRIESAKPHLLRNWREKKKPLVLRPIKSIQLFFPPSFRMEMQFVTPFVRD